MNSKISIKVPTVTDLYAQVAARGDCVLELKARNYFGYLVAAYTTNHSVAKGACVWRFAINDGKRWHFYAGIPNMCTTRASALKRAWYRSKWLQEEDYNSRYGKCNKT